jgi:uncharacterized protein (DUF305 family)
VWRRTVLIGAAAVAALVVVAGCGGGRVEQHPAEHGTSAAAPSSQDHSDTDVGFAQHMIPHHQQAIAMSDIVLGKKGIDPRVTDLAAKIKAAQGPEITQMQDWLTQWGIAPMPSMAPGDGHDTGDSMGMMSDAQMTALKNANGVEAGRLFLTGMIAHHEGAIAMAQPEIGNGQFAPAVALAKSIATTQQQEIEAMKAILATL